MNSASFALTAFREVRSIASVRYPPIRARWTGARRISLGSRSSLGLVYRVQPRTDKNPINRKEYLLHVMRRV